MTRTRYTDLLALKSFRVERDYAALALERAEDALLRAFGWQKVIQYDERRISYEAPSGWARADLAREEAVSWTLAYLEESERLDEAALPKREDGDMRKHDEISNQGSCFNRARIDERLFVLLARDVAAPVAIRAWVAERIRLGKNRPEDPQIAEALDCADRMERERA